MTGTTTARWDQAARRHALVATVSAGTVILFLAGIGGALVLTFTRP